MIYELMKWTNENQGVVSVSIFLITIVFGWATGIFQSLRRKPKFKVEILPGPTQCSTFLTGKKYNDYELHRTAISIYLKVSNVGSAPASIENVSIGYHWHLNKLNWMWLKYRIMWFWLKDPIISMQDFQNDIGENVRIYPFLLQITASIMKSPQTYLLVGQSANGVVYFEQQESWGGCFPSPQRGSTKIKIRIRDSFGNVYYKSAWIPVVSLEDAKKYCPTFGGTFEALRKQQGQEVVA